ncbi:predicted protein [Phaeodactylum tricornutum CCAP 1055/1]|jgi:hypothetical protein|uniref:Uncharacterized protein n=1 Tax=Phaeodactylum tricornutum (strain CCAP 1055/1) TaxID=556484 RepID=B7G0L0_PHATC|nr:predicted protein [Phaeodactylum tricornutum CCAP 1055/1]EEC48106.1 predicted protein [Phaeodactylum tricornutum CCAP 1055/1]|eukprot:XP_002180698.1 predicted protein [Phaeodactylum tricornutum CCAP 1055/1]
MSETAECDLCGNYNAVAATVGLYKGDMARAASKQVEDLERLWEKQLEERTHSPNAAKSTLSEKTESTHTLSQTSVRTPNAGWNRVCRYSRESNRSSPSRQIQSSLPKIASALPTSNTTLTTPSRATTSTVGTHQVEQDLSRQATYKEEENLVLDHSKEEQEMRDYSFYATPLYPGNRIAREKIKSAKKSRTCQGHQLQPHMVPNSRKNRAPSFVLPSEIIIPVIVEQKSTIGHSKLPWNFSIKHWESSIDRGRPWLVSPLPSPHSGTAQKSKSTHKPILPDDMECGSI